MNVPKQLGEEYWLWLKMLSHLESPVTPCRYKELVEIWPPLISALSLFSSSDKQMNPILRKHLSKLVTQLSFREKPENRRQIFQMSAILHVFDLQLWNLVFLVMGFISLVDEI